jgi:hypothetical protein
MERLLWIILGELKVLIRMHLEDQNQERCDYGSRDLSDMLRRWRKRPQTKEIRLHLETGKRQGNPFSPKRPRRECNS